MDFTEQVTVVVSILALAAAGVMGWRTIRRQREVPEEEKARQFRRFTRRRLAMCAILAVVGVALPIGIFLLRDKGWAVRHAGDLTVFWLGLIVLLFVLLGLAVADVYAVLYAKVSEHYQSDHWRTPAKNREPGSHHQDTKGTKEN